MGINLNHLEKKKKTEQIFKMLVKRMPGLRDRLIRADIHDTPEYFLKKVLLISFIGSFAFCFLFLLPVLNMFSVSGLIALAAFPIIFLLAYVYMMKLPDLKAARLEREITKELLFAVRFLIVELESGIIIFKAFSNIRSSYPTIGKYFGEVVDLVDYGISTDEALNRVVNKCPSENLRMVFVQVQNTMRTGSDVATALNSTVEQFSREEKIMVDEYAKKLNPIAMFYMIVAVIFPSIGFMMIIIVSSFIGFEIDLPILLFVALILAFVQYMFVSMIKTMRPPVEF